MYNYVLICINMHNYVYILLLRTFSALCSCGVGIVYVLISEMDHVFEYGAFYDFQPIIICVIISQVSHYK